MPWSKGDRVVLSVDGRDVDAVIVLASANGASLMVAFDAWLDGCVGMMPLLSDADGTYRNIVTNHVIGCRDAE
jgi:hypothetical protein